MLDRIWFVRHEGNSFSSERATQSSERLTSDNRTNGLGADFVPTLSLPKGGGAIRGIGEKFTLNAATGSGSLTIPLATSKGRSNFGPQLSLSYDSASGNGPFGFGWSLSLPTITRKTDKGLPRYRDTDESDVFLFSGAEDLVPILDSNGKRISFPRTVHGIDYNIRLYRPRIEGLFARIERWTRTDNKTSHWRTITRDNVTTIFGFDSNSRIFDPQDERRIFSYLISLVFDDKGNVTRYEYVDDDSRGIEKSAAHEMHRTDATRRTQRYLKTVRYGNTIPYFPDWSAAGTATPLPEHWHFQIVFDYGDHRALAPAPVPDPNLDPDWTVRPDPFSTYRPGFEVRTYRRCKRVLLFHEFVGANEFSTPTLVRSTDFVYSDQVTEQDREQAAARNPIYTCIASVSQTGYRRKTTGGYEQRSTPPLEFFYSQPRIHPQVHTLTDENLPEGFDGTRFQLVDLDGEGLAGILSDEGESWSYKRNLSPLNQVQMSNGSRVPRASFGPREQIASLPVPASLGSAQLLDLTGVGRPQLVAFDSAVPGYFARTSDQDWEPLKAFMSLPKLEWSDPNLKFVDLTGDGRADILITGDDLYTFYPSLGGAGFAEAQRVPTALDEERGPRVVFADRTQTISLADMSGDGLNDIVRVRSGEVCYWPNLGYGRFGARVTMDNAPRFISEERFDPQRIRFADVDGSGTTDLLHVGDDGVEVCFNRSGNSWAEPHPLAIFPTSDNLSAVQVTDLLGTGTACLVWSSPLPAESYACVRYVDLMGSQKPHLLERMRNNLGAETRLSYAPSTRFYLQDKRAGKPWITRLPFPVHVVERVETYDWLGRSRFVTRYAYHHGYFDGVEREFRGFGMVEQWDTETHLETTLFPEVEITNESAASFVPPIHTRTWFHTGAFSEANDISRQYIDEYWIEPALRATTAVEKLLLDDSVFEDSRNLDPDELREAYRALKGSPLRVETYADDGTPSAVHPYTITEQNFVVRRVQRRGPNQHAVFMTYPRESLSCQYERQEKDPRVAHAITLKVDSFGNVERSVNIGYGRRHGYPEPEPQLTTRFRTMLKHDQTRLHAVATEAVFTAPVNQPQDASMFDSYRAPLPCETVMAELCGIAPRADRFDFDELDQWPGLWDGTSDRPYEEISTAQVEGEIESTATARRIVERTRMLYRRDDLTGLLPFRESGAKAFPGESYQLALTPGLLSRVFGTRVDEATLTEGGYRQIEQAWWIPSGRVFYSRDDNTNELDEATAHFFQLRRFVHPLGGVSHIRYDDYDLLPSQVEDAAGNITAATNDYRVLQPAILTDPNHNSSEVMFDCLGQVVGTALRGKSGEGDSLADFNPDLSPATMELALRALDNNQLDDAQSILGNATSRLVYDLFSYFNTRDNPAPDPPMVYTLTRETHASDLDGESTRYQHALTYSDGFGREVQRKLQAERRDGDVSPRWVGTGWTIYNNKGKPVRKYEPFFSTTHRFEFNGQAGVSSVLFYDPAERVVATLHPDNTFEKTIFDAWRQETWDRNDMALISDPRQDPELGDLFTRLLGNNAFQSWHDKRIGGTFGANSDEQAANKDAAQKVAAQQTAGGRKGTPAVVHFDSLGRACLSVSDNGAERFATRTAFDAEGKPLAIFDAKERRVMEFCRRETLSAGAFRYLTGYDVAGRQIYQNGLDGGERYTLSNAEGNPLRSWNARGFTFSMKYDTSQRLTHRFVEHSEHGTLLLDRLVYGEKHPDAARNLKGKLYRHYDGAGVVSNERYDFKGNLLESARTVARLTPPTEPDEFYLTMPDWSAIDQVSDDPVLDIADIDSKTSSLLVAADRFRTLSRFDALNRPIQIVTPHRTTGPADRPSVIQPTFNEANLLDRVDLWLRQADAPSGLLNVQTATTHVVTNIDYNARGQREKIAYGNGVVTEYRYDSETFRLTKLVTTRPTTFPASPDERTVQDLAYQYDPVGNITSLRDAAGIQSVVYFRNTRIVPAADYTYDALYRLTSATGREHLGQSGNSLKPPEQITNDESHRTNLLNPGDGNAMGEYTETYEYDSVGNLLKMIHQVASGGWTRHYAYAEQNQITNEITNRLSANSQKGDKPEGPYSATYAYDDHGNMTQMPHLPRMTWDADDHLQSTTRQSIKQGMPETTIYSYDASGERVRKVTFNKANPGTIPVIKSERLYLGGFEIYREYTGGTVTKERETLQVMDDKQRVAIIETRTLGTDSAPQQMTRYQYTNHLGSAALELDENAAVISYEEYFPYGATSYQAVRNQTDTPKRYRYSGKERDEENDLYYHSARYYSPWLGRWTSCDPAGFCDGINLYVYVGNNPMRFCDPAGTKKEPEPKPTQAPIDPKMAAYREHLIKGATLLAKGVRDFGSPLGTDQSGRRTGSFDNEYWQWNAFTENDEPSELILTLLPGKKPADAIEAIFKNPGRWTFDCATFNQVVTLYAILHTLEDQKQDKSQPFGAEFNSYMAEAAKKDLGEVILRSHHSTGVATARAWEYNQEDKEFKYLRRYEGGRTIPSVPSEKGIEALVAEAPIGSEVVFTDTRAPEGHSFRSENMLKIGPDEYIAFGFGRQPIVTAKFVRERLAEMFTPKKQKIRMGLQVNYERLLDPIVKKYVHTRAVTHFAFPWNSLTKR